MKSTRRGSFSVHRWEKTPGSKYSSTSGLSPRGHLERSEEHTSELQSPKRSTLFPYTTLFRSMKSTRRGSFSVHRWEKTPGSKYSSTSGLSPRGHLERQAEFHASTQDEA